ncbi:MAG: GTPase ObgE [Bacilli bacterium]|jgi:GTP-binding protein
MNDKVKVTLCSGKGGDGAIAFRREKCVEAGGPYGGNGGKGGSIYLLADNGINSLSEYRFGKTIRANDGENGLSKLCYGKDAKDIILHVPLGTVIEDENGEMLADLYRDGDKYLAVKGGRGGRGNACFKSSVKRTPNIAENGMPGQEKVFYFELKLIADVGLVGFPNAGKSTFLASTTRAHPAIADYPFTTLEPQLGVCYYKPDKSFVIADIPGLIEGASQGRGLGFSFLRHIERCRVLLHIIDLSNGRDPYQDFLAINHELFTYKPDLEKRTMVVALNKCDLVKDDSLIEKFKKQIGDKYPVFIISAKDKEGLEPLIRKLYGLVSTSKVEEKKQSLNPMDEEEKVYKADKHDNGVKPQFQIVKREDGYYEIVGERVVRTKQLINLKTDEGIDRLSEYLDRIGVNDRLHDLGVKTGATIVLDGFEFEYYE